MVLVKFRKKEGYKNNLFQSVLLKEFKNIAKRSLKEAAGCEPKSMEAQTPETYLAQYLKAG